MSDKDRMREADLKRRLNEVLRIYGAEPDRWPPDERELLIPVAGDMETTGGETELATAGATERQSVEGPDSASLVEEERALDRLLDMVDAPVPPDGAIERLIVAAGGTPGEVVAFSEPRPLISGPVVQAPRNIPCANFTFRPAIGLVAASLLLGLITGTSRIADPLYLRSMSDAVMDLEDAGAGILGLAREDYGFEEDDL